MGSTVNLCIECNGQGDDTTEEDVLCKLAEISSYAGGPRTAVRTSLVRREHLFSHTKTLCVERCDTCDVMHPQAHVTVVRAP
jgi:hypothetical protein